MHEIENVRWTRKTRNERLKRTAGERKQQRRSHRSYAIRVEHPSAKLQSVSASLSHDERNFNLHLEHALRARKLF